MIATRGRQCRALEQLLDDRRPPLGRERPVRQRHAQLVVALDDPREPEQLVLDLGEVALGLGDLEQRPGVDVDAVGHRLVAPDLVDEAVDELHLRVAVEVALDDPLGQLDRDRRHVARSSAIARSRWRAMSAWAALADLGGLVLGARDEVAARPARPPAAPLR